VKGSRLAICNLAILLRSFTSLLTVSAITEEIPVTDFLKINMSRPASYQLPKEKSSHVKTTYETRMAAKPVCDWVLSYLSNYEKSCNPLENNSNLKCFQDLKTFQLEINSSSK
jgi:hypothetical protein